MISSPKLGFQKLKQRDRGVETRGWEITFDRPTTRSSSGLASFQHVNEQQQHTSARRLRQSGPGTVNLRDLLNRRRISPVSLICRHRDMLGAAHGACMHCTALPTSSADPGRLGGAHSGASCKDHREERGCWVARPIQGEVPPQDSVCVTAMGTRRHKNRHPPAFLFVCLCIETYNPTSMFHGRYLINHCDSAELVDGGWTSHSKLSMLILTVQLCNGL